MAFPTIVNDQITDSITQTNITVLASAPAVAMGSLYQSTGAAMAASINNAVSAQQNNNTISTSVTAKCVSALMNK